MYSAQELGDDQLTLSVDGRGFINVHGDDVKKSVFLGDLMIPLQFTGLHDLKGVEIYEGDVVKFPDGTHEVKYAEHTACFHAGGKNFTDRLNIEGSSDREILGDVYEHPELLKSEV